MIQKQNTYLREALSVQEKLAIILRYLAIGETFISLLYQYHIHRLTISQFLLDVCKAIYIVLAPDYMKLLCLKEEWKNIIEQTNERWLIPNCFTAVDGGIICPKHPRSMFYNNRGFYSIVLSAFVD